MIPIGRLRLIRRFSAIAFGLVTIVGSEVVADGVLNPATYTSPSGEYKLFVEPSAMDGNGPATYRLTHAGEEVWSDDLEFSLWEAEVTDGGAVVGYAYEEGVFTDLIHGTRYSGLSIIILDAEGRTLLRDPASSHDPKVRVNSWGSNSPCVLGMVTDEDRDRFLVRIPRSFEEDPVVWWTYRISTGKKLGDIVPDHPHFGKQGFQNEIFAKIVPGTSLILVQWYIYGSTNGKHTDSAVLSLLDPDGKEIWKLNLPGDYDNLIEGWSWYWDMIEPGITQTDVSSQSFSFRSYSLSSRISYDVEADPKADSGWRVVETSRVKDQLPVGRDSVSRPDIELIELEQVGVIELKTPDKQESSLIGGISDFAIDRAGNIGFVKWGANGSSKFIRVDPTGKILSNFTLHLPQEENVRLSIVVPVMNDRWVLVRPSYADGVGTKAWWINIVTGKLELVEGFESGFIETIVQTGEGGFITLANYNSKYTFREGLNRYSKDGSPLWNRQVSDSGRDFMFMAATWLEGVGAAALTGVSNTIEFFDVDGKHQRSVKVSDIIQGKPNYPAGLTADLNGGLILHDFNGSPPIYRIDAEGKVIAKFHPKFPDGRTFRIYGDVKAAPDGTLWTSDHHSLLRLNENGVVDRILGLQPDNDALDEIRAMTVDAQGMIYVLNARTAAVHVFDSDGVQLRICKPLPTDFATDSGIGTITVDGDGSIFYKTGGDSGAGSNNGYLGFSAKCERIGFKHLGIDSITEEWLFKPGSRKRWVLGYETLYLVDEQPWVTKTIDRRPNREWLQRPQDGAVALDGSIAVIAGLQGMFGRESNVICIYDADGSPVKNIPVIDGSIMTQIAFNGSTVVTTNNGALYLYDINSDVPRKFVLPKDEGESRHWYAYMSPDGNEIWLRPSESMTLLRYKLP